MLTKIAQNWILALVLSSGVVWGAFDNGGNPRDHNRNCPGERISLPAGGPSPFVGNGNVRADRDDYWDRFRFRIPISGTVRLTLRSHTDLDFKMGTSCGSQNIIRYTDDHNDVKTYSFHATAGHTYYITLFDDQWRDVSNPYTLTIDYPTSGGGGTPPRMDDVPNRTVAKNSNFTLDLSDYAHATDGDAITRYRLDCTIPGLTFNRNTGRLSGRPSRVDTYNCRAAAKDKDGWSQEKDFTIEVIPAGSANCENYDTADDNRCPGSLIASMDGITTDKSTCIIGKSSDDEGWRSKRDFYRFTVQTAGKLRIRGSSPNGHAYHLRVGSSCGGRQYYGDRTRRNHDTGWINLHAGDTIYIRAKETGGDTDWYRLNLDFRAAHQGTPPHMGNVPDKSVDVGENFTINLATYVTRTEGDPILSYSIYGTLPPGVNFDSSAGTISGAATRDGTYTVQVSATDQDGESNKDTIVITVNLPSNIPPIMDAVPDQEAKIDHSFVLNLADYTTQTDGDPVTYHLSGTLPDGLSFDSSTGRISGTPDNQAQINQSFSLEVWASDKDGDSSPHRTFNIRIRPKDTQYNGGDLPFTRVNPEDTRNVAGNYIILGNTVECHTRSPYDFPEKANQGCVDIPTGNNNKVMNYIDIDDDPNTWNSSRAYFVLPPNSEILWAGLWWQANLNIRGENSERSGTIHQRHAEPNAHFGPFGRGWHWVDNPRRDNNGQSFDIRNYDANKVLIKIDGETDYRTVQADTIANEQHYGNKGGVYAAYADITSIVRAKHLAPGQHTVQVANIMATMGREPWMGDYGGWSMVVIYRQLQAQPKNISIYNGFSQVHTGGQKRKTIRISGFKLPKHGRVEAHMSVFSGEGEKNNRGDTMKIEDQFPPGTTDRWNIFDEIMTPTVRAHRQDFFSGGVNINKLLYAGTIDVDDYDVSDLMSQMRDANPNVNAVTIKLASLKPSDPGGPTGADAHDVGPDAFFPSMIAFATDLYVPEVCYDYEVRWGSDVHIPSENNDINASVLHGLPLNIVIALRSREGDFPLEHSKLTLHLDPEQNLTFIGGRQSPDNVNAYLPAITVSNPPAKLAFGNNVVDKSGGTLDELQTFYVEYSYEVNPRAQVVNTHFEVDHEFTINFGGGDVNITRSSMYGTIPRCGTVPGYRPEYGILNTERPDSGNYDPRRDKPHRYMLPTQVAGKRFTLNAVLYDSTFENELRMPRSTYITSELIDANRFRIDNETNTSVFVCAYPDPLPGTRKLVEFPGGQSRASIPIDTDFALPNVAVRLRYLSDSSHRLIPTNCSDKNDAQCWANVYDTYIKNDRDKNTKYCLHDCDNGSGSDCYTCLQNYFSTSVCSRDNFAIRPESFYVAIKDNNESRAVNSVLVTENNGSVVRPANTVAEYEYRLDGFATLYNQNKKAKRYYQFFPAGAKGMMRYRFRDTNATMYNRNPAACTDRLSYTLNVVMQDGEFVGENNSTSLRNKYPIKGDNAGLYLFHLVDANFTAVDQRGYKYKPFPDIDDCENSQIDPAAMTQVVQGEATFNNLNGCVISSRYANRFHDLNLSFVPDRFDLSGVNLVRSPGGGNGWLYMNNLSNNHTNNPMALALRGPIRALGAKGGQLSNYTDGCVAKDLNLTDNMHFDRDPSSVRGAYHANPVSLRYQLVDTRGSRVGDINDTNSSDNSTLFRITNELGLPKADFVSSASAGAGSMDLRLFHNFTRRYDDPVNPVEVNVTKVGANIPNLTAHAHMLSDYVPQGSKVFDQNFTFYYGRANPSKYLYDDITAASVKTPISFEVFCNLLAQCGPQYDLNATTSEPSMEYDWRVNLRHNSNAGDGKIYLRASSGARVSPSPVSVNNVGTNRNVTVTATTAARPLDVNITFGPGTDDWLIYNRTGSNTVPNPFYRVRFIGVSGWAGYGDTGHVVESNASIKKNKRLEW